MPPDDEPRLGTQRARARWYKPPDERWRAGVTMSDMIGRTLEGYRIDAEIGRGGQAVVYRATQLSLQRTVALKVVSSQYSNDPGFRERFRLEGISAARLEHPNIVPVYEAGDAEGLSFLAMKYVEGASVDAVVRSSGAFPVRRALNVLDQIAAALDHADHLGVVHRDVKPANILLGPADHAYLSDFGLARAIEAAGLTESGTWLGTLEYVAPEQISGSDISAAADRYALAMVATEMLTGSPAFQRESRAAMLYAHLHDAPSPPSDARPALGPEVDAVITQGLAKAPEDRHPSAAAFVAALQAAVDATPGAADAPPPPPTPAPAAIAVTDTGGPRPEVPTGETVVGEVAPPSAEAEVGTAAPADPDNVGRSPAPPSGDPGPERVPLWKRPKFLIPAGVGAVAVIAAIVLSVVFIGGDDPSGPTSGGGPDGPGGTEQLLPASIEGWTLTEVAGDGVLGIDPGPQVDQKAAQASQGSDVAQVWGLAPSGNNEATTILSRLRSSIGGERLDTIPLANDADADLSLAGGAFIATYESDGRVYVVLAGTRDDTTELVTAMGEAT
jgi:hypothetical protein